ncbi:hypothetical protein N657DRAFT_646530 [Parathielavia appendiculata]|uniref:tRNA wybutosine-synthesizing protein 2 n=1 Tax=Parathielavia appendiculata TaxID=2587402 RepID=A0AAN6Z2D3_9PEZI|nr:hypothetical protein N657DRAFT_646530 [Parathielavia appendiculata]
MSRPPKPKNQNPIQIAVSSWLDSLPPTSLDSLVDRSNNMDVNDNNDINQLLLSRAPKRWVVYEPMVLLPSGSFTAQPWPALLSSLTGAQKECLWAGILGQLSPGNSKPPLTHLAINEGIPLHFAEPSDGLCKGGSGSADEGRAEKENLLRAPRNLHPLHGDFGPLPSPSSSKPTDFATLDFSAALWASTTQNGLIQTWAPLHTMFSRGNIKEKARLLAFHSASASPSSSSSPSSLPDHRHQKRQAMIYPQSRRRQGQGGTEKWAVDLYAGIGYFAFSYARLGMRVLCWEVNPWSVEGLRRGAQRNGFTVKVIIPTSSSPDGIDMDQDAVIHASAEQIVVFLEDNALAAGRIAAARRRGWAGDVVHVNCGFLPSSEPVWRDAFGMVAGQGWLHLHENVADGDIEARKVEVQRLFDRWGTEEDAKEAGREEGAGAEVEHVELVKTYAPGVWHCVFDVFIRRSSAVV